MVVLEPHLGPLQLGEEVVVGLVVIVAQLTLDAVDESFHLFAIVAADGVTKLHDEVSKVTLHATTLPPRRRDARPQAAPASPSSRSRGGVRFSGLTPALSA